MEKKNTKASCEIFLRYSLVFATISETFLLASIYRAVHNKLRDLIRVSAPYGMCII